jgi:hypothetical protein
MKIDTSETEALVRQLRATQIRENGLLERLENMTQESINYRECSQMWQEEWRRERARARTLAAIATGFAVIAVFAVWRAVA